MSNKLLIGSYVHMREKPREQHALFMLRKIASLVKPIMVHRGFRVGCLAEFYPAQDNLLGLNIDAGRQICIRLRQPYDQNTFLNLEDCVYTMLHELTHNLHGPHNEVFHAYLRGLEEEYIAVRTSGYNGEGFYSEGHRLGTGRAPKPSSIADARRRALAAAEKRRIQSSGSGQRPGGGNVGSINPNHLSIAERIANAALRRIRAPKACGAESGSRDRGRMEKDAERAIRNGFRTQAEADEADEAAILQAAIELIEIGEREEEEAKRRQWREQGHIWIDDYKPVIVPAPTPTTRDTGPRHPRSRPSDSSRSFDSRRHVPIELRGDSPLSHADRPVASTWTCNLCTLINPIGYLSCDACGVQKQSQDEIQIIDGLAWAQGPSNSAVRPGGLRGSASAQRTERVRFGINPVTPAKRMWDCYNCRGTNDVEWPACASCGVLKLRT